MKTNGKVVRPNPLLSFTVNADEYQKLKKLALQRGVSIAQVGRGLFRQSFSKRDCYFNIIPDLDEIVRLGVF